MSFYLLLVWLGNPPLFQGPAQLAHTYSIVAFDPETGEIGGAVQSHWFNVEMVIWVEPGVGAVATQSLVRLDYGPLGLSGMAAGEKPVEVLKRLSQADEGREVRQVAMVDASGAVAAFTGKRCIANAGDRQGRFYSVQANIMLRDTVCDAMAAAFEAARGPLAERLLAALKAAQKEGGDLRGKQSSALKVVTAAKPANPWEGVVVDLRVADHPEPVDELARLLVVHNAYQIMNEGDLALEHGETDAAMAAYAKAVGQLPGRMEPVFWQAVNLAGIGRVAEALPLFKRVFNAEPDWRLMPERLVKSGFLPEDAALLAAIAAQ